VSPTVLVAMPPYYTSATYPKKMMKHMNRNRLLLKKPAKTL